jgi:RimJ/RimL family protein N-acetyltransferase
VRTFFNEVTSKKGLRVILRPPKWSDIDDLYELYNELVDEEAMIGGDSKRPRDQQVDSHAEMMKSVEGGRAVVVIAEVEGKAVGQSNASKRGGRLRHTAGLGVFVKKQYRNQGIGSELMKELENQAKKIGVEILYLEVYGISPATGLYERLGYREYGRLPCGIKYRGEYVDRVSMYKRIAG